MSQEGEPTGRTALITGESRGIGAAIAPAAVPPASDDGAFYVGRTLSPDGGDMML